MELSLYIYIVLLVLCSLIGFLGGLLGIALGAIRLPLIIFLGVEPIIAASTNLLAVIFGSLAGLFPAIKQKRVPIRSTLNIGSYNSCQFGFWCRTERWTKGDRR